MALPIDPKKKTPINVPTMLPLPPFNAVPPMTTMAMLSISRPCPKVMMPGVNPREKHDRTDADQQTHDEVDRKLHVLDVDSRQVGCVRVSPNGIDPSTILGIIQKQPGQQRDHEEDQDVGWND